MTRDKHRVAWNWNLPWICKRNKQLKKSTKEKSMLHTNKFVKLEKTTYQRRLWTCEGPEFVLDAGQELWQETAARRYHSSPPGALAAWPKPPWCRRLQLTSTGFHKGRRLNVLHRLALSYKEQPQGSIAFRTFVKDCSVLHIFSAILIPGSTDSDVLKQIITVCYIHKYSTSPSVSPTLTGVPSFDFLSVLWASGWQGGWVGGGGGGGNG